MFYHMRLHFELKIVWRLGCARARKGILSVPLDSQRHSGRSEKEQSLTPLAAVMCVLQLGRDGEEGRTGIGKGNWKEGQGNFILNNYSARDVHVK